MNYKEQCIDLINTFDETQLPSVASFLKNLKTAIEEAVDDAFCSALYNKAVFEDDGSFVTASQLYVKYGI